MRRTKLGRRQARHIAATAVGDELGAGDLDAVDVEVAGKISDALEA